MPDDLSHFLSNQFTIAGITPEGVPYEVDCGAYAVRFETTENTWAFPVGDADYPPESWYVPVVHSLDGSLNYNNYKHSGIDIDLAMHEFGDVERRLGLHIYAIAEGIVTHKSVSWSGVPMIVVKHYHDGAPLWVRYAHIIPSVKVGEKVHAGQSQGLFANWQGGDGGDHIHFDMATDKFTTEWLTPSIRWLDPVPVLKAHLPADKVDAMIAKGRK